MTSRIKYKWLLLVFIWAGCFLLCIFNADTVNRILDSREKKEILQRDMTFWKQNKDTISRVIEQQSLLIHEIDSLKMGIVFLNDTFNKLAADFDLADIKVEMDARQSEGNSMPVRASFKCQLKNGLDAIQKIQNEYSFIPFRSVKVVDGKAEKSANFDILLDYKYHLTDIQKGAMID